MLQWSVKILSPGINIGYHPIYVFDTNACTQVTTTLLDA